MSRCCSTWPRCRRIGRSWQWKRACWSATASPRCLRSILSFRSGASRATRPRSSTTGAMRRCLCAPSTTASPSYSAPRSRARTTSYWARCLCRSLARRGASFSRRLRFYSATSIRRVNSTTRTLLSATTGATSHLVQL